VRLAVVVQRYGPTISGGAEAHARYVAEHLARHVEVEVVTTCAADYLSWRNELPEGRDRVNGVAVHRFPVAHPRHPRAFARWSEQVFEHPHSLASELRWLDVEGPASPALVRYVRAHISAYDFWIFFSYRYYQSYHGARAASRRAVLVPTAERDPALGLALFGPVFRGVRALMYNSPEERAMIQAVSSNQQVPGVVVGVGSEIPRFASAERTGRSEQGLRRAVPILSALRAKEDATVARRDRDGAHADSRSPSDPPPGLSRRAGQVRCHGGCRAAHHAVAVRESLDGDARSMGTRPAGARQRTL
jgi:hypothetical protein